MRYPPRLAHLATRAVVAAKLAPIFGEAHQLDDEEAVARANESLKGRLLDDLLDACWTALQSGAKRVDDEALLDKVASSLKNRPLRPGKVKPVTPAWNALMILADLEAGTASEVARKMLETPEGKKMAAMGLLEGGRHLAEELTRK